MSSTFPDMPGDMLGEHYRIERELGHGGMATVYLCTDLRDTSQVAVKVLRPELGSVVTRERFLREIRFVSGLDHPRIPQVIDTGTAGITPYYAMKFIDGESLRDKMNREHRFPVGDVARIAAAIAGPTGYAHARNIIHRDIKPENVLLSGDEVYVLDFGVARAIIDAGGERLTRTGITVGTPAYMSPEQVSGKKDVDFRSDIYSLGCVVYEMLAGFPPFSGATPQLLMAARFTRTPVPLKSVRDDVPTYMARAVDKAMEFLPDDRWQSVEAFADALQPKDAQTHGSGAVQPGPEDLEATALLEKLKKTFADTYEVHSEMKGGGMSRLFLATDVALRRKVVIKILPPELVSPMMLARFRRESEVTAQLQHPHILPVISAGVKDELVHYIMPFIDGESLRDLLERDPQIPIPFATRILREMLDALAYAHKFGVIHRDIKPENVLIQDGHAVLADFGIAAALTGDSGGGNRLTGTGMSLGTVGYMAPEQALGQRNVDVRSDIYSVGVVGYEIFSGQPPFTGITDQEILVAHLTKEAPSVSVLRADTPPTIAQSIKKAMEKDPANRFQTAAAFRDALDSGADVFTAPIPTLTTAPAVTVPVGGGKPSKKNLFIGVAAALVIALGGFAWMTLRANSATAGDIYTITVVPFNALGSGLELWHEGMVDMLARNLDGAGPIRTVSPTVAIRRYRADSAKLGGGNRNMAESMARAAKADYAIFGTIVGKQNDSVHMRASLVNMSSNTQADFEKSFATPEAATDSFTVFVLNEIQQAHRLGAVRQSSVGSANVSALKAFLQGEQFYRRTSWDSAAVAYARAISFDGKFALALRSAARVAGWQKSGSDSTARELKLRAGQFNHGLSPRDSLLVLADSLSAALSSQSIDSLDWNKAARLFATVDTAAARYPNDPDVWYTVGEARFHNGYGSPVNVSEQQTLDAFDKAIALDSAFAPAYVHPVELGFTLHGAEAGRKYADAYLALNPTDNEAAGIAILDRIASVRRGESSVTDKMLDSESSDAIMAAWYAARRWPDSAQTALRLLHAIERKPHSSPTYTSDSIRLWNFLPLQLAYRGRLRESYFVLGNRPWRLFAELAMLGAIPADTVNAVFRKWAADGIPQAYFAYSWLAQHRDTAALAKLIEKAKGASGTGGPLAQRAARYRATSGNAYLSLAKGDTTAAISQFLELPDTLCIACYVDRLNTARLLESRGRLKEADSLLKQRLNTLLTPAEIIIALERARVAEKLGNRDAALRAYRLVVDAWEAGDPEVQPMVEESRMAAARLGGAKP